MTNITLFSQIISKLDRFSFTKLVTAHQTDKHQKGYTSWTHLVAMLFCHFVDLIFYRLTPYIVSTYFSIRPLFESALSPTDCYASVSEYLGRNTNMLTVDDLVHIQVYIDTFDLQFVEDISFGVL